MKTPRRELNIVGSLVSLLMCFSCSDSAPGLADKVKASGTEAEWHAWAAEMIERSRTNSAPIPRTELPLFVRRATPYGANGIVSKGMDSNRTSIVIVATYGGFQSIGVIVGPPTYVEAWDATSGLISKQVFPGV